MDSNFTNENDPWEYSLDIDDSDLHLTPVLRSSSSARVEPSSSTPNPVRIIPGPAGTVQLSSSTCFEPSSSTPNPVRIIPGPAGLVQQAKQLKEKVFILDSDGALMSTQEYMQKVVEDVGEDDDFNSGAWISATNYVISTGGTVTGCLGDFSMSTRKKLEEVLPERLLPGMLAGPGTIAEALIRGLPVILNDYIPGHEKGKVPYVAGNGANESKTKPVDADKIRHDVTKDSIKSNGERIIEESPASTTPSVILEEDEALKDQSGTRIDTQFSEMKIGFKGQPSVFTRSPQETARIVAG
ncbi:hypothetical protein Tco_0059780, partial [Tanacetum coccineum]